VYVLEQVAEYIRTNALHEGDAIGICADEQGALSIEVMVLPFMPVLSMGLWTLKQSLDAAACQCQKLQTVWPYAFSCITSLCMYLPNSPSDPAGCLGRVLLRPVWVAQANTAAVRSGVIRPVYGALLVLPQLPPPEAAKAAPLIFGAPGRCTRSPSCVKPSGHPGFCSGPRAAELGFDHGPPAAASHHGSATVSGGSTAGSVPQSWRPPRRAGPPAGRLWAEDSDNCSDASDGGRSFREIAAARLLRADELAPDTRIAKALTKQDLHTGQVGAGGPYMCNLHHVQRLHICMS
jgi:hypothetical protein